MNAHRIFDHGVCLKNRVWCSPSRHGEASGTAWVRVSRQQNTLKRGHQTAARSCSGFTLVELLVVMASIAVLTMVLLPALAGTRPNSQAFQCENNTKRLMLAWLMYSSDNGDKLMSRTTWITNTPYLDWTYSTANTNTAALLNPSLSLIANYIRSATVFKCPADAYEAANGPRVRSYSLSAGLGGGALNNQNYTPGRTYPLQAATKMSDLNTPGPARIWGFLDEHPDSIDDGNFHLDAGQQVGGIYWRNMPASFHNGSYGVSFADGHCEIVTLVELGRPGRPTSLLPVVPHNAYSFLNNYNNGPYFSGGHYNVGRSDDYQRLNDGMPYRLN
jgi:prepilin-type N-terminal cleavage/methylation domain-containing protein/prepilin-type processing-associated H-X9-DG protein